MGKAKYSTYKPSKTLWQTEIPSHWQETEIRMLFGENKTKNIGLVERNLLSLSYGKLKRKDIDNATGLVPASFEGYQIIEDGYIVLRFTDLQNDKKSLRVGYANERGIITSAYVGLAPKADIHSKYFYYQLHFLDKIKYFYNLGGGVRQSLAFKEFGRETILIPEKDEQICIVKYLDFKLAKAEKFIRKKKQLIKLLNEQKAAIINQVVTKGLDTNAKMKDSGIEWLGEIPQHWEVRKIKWLTPVKRGASPRPIENPIYFDIQGEYAWVRIADVTASKRYLENTVQTLSELGASLSVKQEPGDIFLSIAGSVGKPIITKIKCCIHDGFVWFPKLRINREFIYYIFSAGRAYLGLGKLGTQLNLNTETVGSISIPIPPESEIESIVKFLDKELNVFENTISKIEKEIELVEEYKTTLIAEAVTGKIDVRGYVVPQVDSEEVPDSYRDEDLEEEMSMAAEDGADYQTEETE